MLDPVILAQILWTGIATAAPFVLMTLGFALTLKVTGLWNFAHAGLMAIAFYVMYFAINTLEWPLAAAIAAAVVITGGASWMTERYGLQVLRDRGSGNLTFFIFTLILSEFLIYVITLLFGTEPQTLFKSILSPVTIVADVAISDWDMTAVAMAGGGMALLYAFLTWTREGQFMGAVADNARLAELYGISARRAWAGVALLASLLIVAAMYLVGTHGGVVPNSPLELILTAVIATLLGGIGRIFAAAFAAVFLGLLQSFSILFIDSRWQNLLLYGVLFVTILIFPRGVRLPRLRLARLGR